MYHIVLKNEWEYNVFRSLYLRNELVFVVNMNFWSCELDV